MNKAVASAVTDRLISASSRLLAEPPLRSRVPYPVGLGLLATTYVVAARLGLLLATMHGNVSPIWPASGLAVAALMLLFSLARIQRVNK